MSDVWKVTAESMETPHSWLEYHYRGSDEPVLRIKQDGCIEWLSDDIGVCHICHPMELITDLPVVYRMALDDYTRRDGWNEAWDWMLNPPTPEERARTERAVADVVALGKAGLIHP